MPTLESDRWHPVQEAWTDHERLIYRSSSAFVRLEFTWDLEKVPNSDEGLIRAQATLNIPLRREQKLSWKTRFRWGAHGPIGFETAEEINEVNGHSRTWKADGRHILVSETGRPDASLALPRETTVHHVLQIPLLLRRPTPVKMSEPIVLILSKRFQALRVLGKQRVEIGQDLQLDAAAVDKEGLSAIDWKTAKSGSLTWDERMGVAREVHIHVPVLGAIGAKLERHIREGF